MTPLSNPIRIGTRKSKLALIQSQLVADRLQHQGYQVELVRVTTEGDKRGPGVAIGDGIFVAELERALRAGEIDLAVHSAKDMALGERPGLSVAAYPERIDPRDALVTRSGQAKVESLPVGARVGTDSPRRAAFLSCMRPDLEIAPIQGNVDSRLAQLDKGSFDALILAAAGLTRLGLAARIDEYLEPSQMLPAPGQGALAVQVRADDLELSARLEEFDQVAVRLAVETERDLLSELDGGCNSPVGAIAEVNEGRLELLYGLAMDGTAHIGKFEMLANRKVARAVAVAAADQIRSIMEVGSLPLTPSLDPSPQVGGKGILK